MKPLTPDLALEALRDSWQSSLLFCASYMTGYEIASSHRASQPAKPSATEQQGEKQTLCAFSAEEKRAQLRKSTIKCVIIFFNFFLAFMHVYMCGCSCAWTRIYSHIHVEARRQPLDAIPQALPLVFETLSLQALELPD